MKKQGLGAGYTVGIQFVVHSYKIDQISKTKNRTKKTREYKNPTQNIAHLLR